MPHHQLVASVTPSGHIDLTSAPSDTPDAPLPESSRLRILDAFSTSRADGVLLLGVLPITVRLHPTLAFWRDLGQAFVATVSTALNPDTKITERSGEVPDLDDWLLNAPPMRGGELLDDAMLSDLWRELGDALDNQAALYDNGIEGFLQANDSAWNTVGRVFFHLAENKLDPEYPFAFLATYVHKISSQAHARHIVLGQALKEYAHARDRAKLRALLAPLHRAAERCELIRDLLDSGDIYHPLSWDVDQSYAFLQEVPLYEQAGLIVRTPDWWNARQKPKVSVVIGQEPSKGLGLDTIVDFNISVTLGGETLTQEEIEDILASEDGLVLLRGKWVELDREKLKEVLDHWEDVKRQADAGGITLVQAMRELAQARFQDDDDELTTTEDWSEVVAGKWLAERLENLYTPRQWENVEKEANIDATLRPYQRAGVQWLWSLKQLGLGGVLADDMGLGKTIQVLSTLSLDRQEKHTSLAIVPATLVSNWLSEVKKFAPHLRVFVAHPSEVPSRKLKAIAPKELDEFDLVITTYAMAMRLPWVQEKHWRSVIADEAQAIKNPKAKQTKAIKQIPSDWTLAMTGTPVENSLSDLWSLFDLVNPGLLADITTFKRFASRLARAESGYAPLRRLIKPYVLRRLKTDKSIISDLPDKTELKAYCHLSKRQAVLYQDAVDELQSKISGPLSRMELRGLILSSIMRLKQICNHPSQWLHQQDYPARDSGKFARLKELCEPIAARQDKVLVFTQFKEIIPALATYLGRVFGRPGLTLDGSTPVGQRKKLVKRFQEDDHVPFIILSLKAGGTGLNLTAASHVIHFDRWWNPAVENQATDRAFRIGQKKSVLVHKFICKGTIEDHIDKLIDNKIKLSAQALDDTGELKLSELGKDELMKLISLDVHAAMGN